MCQKTHSKTWSTLGAPLPAPFPAVVKLLPEPQPETKPSSTAQERLSCWWDWIQVAPCWFSFFPALLPCIGAACAASEQRGGERSERAGPVARGARGVMSFAGLPRHGAERTLRQGRARGPLDIALLKPLGKRGGGTQAGGQPQLRGRTETDGEAGACWIPPSSHLCLTSNLAKKIPAGLLPCSGAQLTGRDGAGPCRAPTGHP